VLQEVVVAAKSCLSSADFLCRYGGEEFTVILSETKISEAIDIAERIRKTVEEHTFYGGDK